MAKAASIAILLLLCAANLSTGQESCPNENANTFVGFTALTPDQLKTEIRTSLRESTDEISENLSQMMEEQSLSALKEINDTIQEGLEMIHELNSDLGMVLLENIEQVVARQVKEAVASVTQDIVANITQLLLEFTPPPPPSTVPPPMTTKAPPTRPTTQQPTTEASTTKATEPKTTTTPPTRPTEPKTTPEPTTEPTTKATTLKPTTPAPTTQAPTLPPLGLSPLNPADSCQDILNSRPEDSPSGTYWLKTTFNTTAVQAYCDMEQPCGGVSGGWMRVVVMNMKDSEQSCPQNFRLLTHGDLRVCRTRHTGAGCRGTFFQVNGVSYSQVCGRVIGYQDRTPNAFFPYHSDSTLTIDDPYVDGISITHGIEREHVWTFVAALDETRGHLSACKCSNTRSQTESRIPSFVGNDYFCDTASRGPVGFEFYSEDPLWDGDGCGDTSTCCSFNTPPWFHKRLGQATNEDLEMRVCRDASVGNEDILFELVELYVR